MVYNVNSSGPRTEHWGTPQNKGSTFEKYFLILLIETYFVRKSGSRYVLCMICHTNQRGDLEEQNNQWCPKSRINLKMLVL